MKRLLIIIGDFILIFTAAAGTLGIVITAFKFPVDISAIIIMLFVAALVVSVLVNLARVKGFLMLLPLIALLAIIEFPRIIDGAKSVIFIITTEYSKWVFVPLLYADSVPDTAEITALFVFIGLLITVLLSAAICLRRSTLFMMLCTMPLSLTAFVLVSTIPDIQYIIILIGSYLTMLISCALQPDGRGQRGTAAFPAIGLTVIILSIAAFITPQDGRTGSGFIREADAEIRLILARLGVISYDSGLGWPLSSEGRWQFNTTNVGIANAGFRDITHTSLLEIKVDTPGIFYLRGYAMERFDGRSWHFDSDAMTMYTFEPLTRGMPARIAEGHHMRISGGGTSRVEMIIAQTGDSTPGIKYVPYYSYQEVFDNYPYSVEFFYNADKGINDMLFEMPTPNLDIMLQGYANWLYRSGLYTQIETSTAVALRQMALDAGINIRAGRANIAEQVAAFISSSARYTLRPTTTPADRDFTLHFLETSKEGYCIHFTTAAVLMLRALDIPARFTSGFAVVVPERDVGSVITLTDRHAHAWVEVYYDNIGWLPLEVTPSSTAYGSAEAAPPTGPTSSIIPDIQPDWEEEYLDHEFPDVTRPSPGNEAQATGPDTPGFWEDWGTAVLIAISVAAFISLLRFRWALARTLRKNRFSQEDPNAAVICVHRYIVRLDRHKKIPDEIEELALKARFSQHIISEDERQKVIKYSSDLRQDICKGKGVISRFLLSTVRGL